MRDKRTGMTLVEVLIAITLLSLLMTGLLFAMRISLNSLGKANDKMMANRRVTGAQRVLEQEIAGLMPVAALTPGAEGQPALKIPFFQGESQSMRFVSTYSLQEGSRGAPKILEFQVVPGGESGGVRLVVNEWPYTGPLSAGAMVTGRVAAPDVGGFVTTFRPIEAGAGSFVLADRLAACRFLFQELRPQPEFQRWTEGWNKSKWPDAIRIEMTPQDDGPGRLKMTTITAPLRVTKSPMEQYEDK